MKLVLYIDTSYIIATELSNGVARLLDLPSREDRLWLYFYEDIANNQIRYGHDYKEKAIERELHYYDNVFNRLLDDEDTFMYYAVNYPFREIFNKSNLIEHLRASFGHDEVVETYLSFSSDISYTAQSIFIEILSDNRFDIKESIVPIELLTIEHSIRNQELSILPNSYCLVISALNQNLKYTLYRHIDRFFVNEELTNAQFNGYGQDLRGRALLQDIVYRLAEDTHLLPTEDDREYEILRLSKYVDSWIEQLDRSPLPIVHYSNITILGIPNQYDVVVLKQDIENRTRATIDKIINSIVENLSRKKVAATHIILLGDIFNNNIFKEALRRRSLQIESIKNYENRDLFKIISVYGFLDLGIFSEERTYREKLSQEEREQLSIADQERKKRKQAEVEEQERLKEKAELQNSEKRYQEAMEEVDRFERLRDYSSMVDVLLIALECKPNSEEAKQLLSEAQRKLTEEAIKSEQYNNAIRLAQEAVELFQWDDAIRKADIALSFKPDSEEALRIQKEATTHQKQDLQLDTYIHNAEEYLSLRQFEKALGELRKSKLISSNNHLFEEKISQLELEIDQKKRKLNQVVQEFQRAEQIGDYSKAIDLCKLLIELDPDRATDHSLALSDLKQKCDSQKAKREKIRELRTKLDNAHFDENWALIIELSNKILDLEEIPEVRKYKEKASEKLKTLENTTKLNSLKYEIEKAISNKSVEVVNQLINRLAVAFPEKKDLIKHYRKSLFDLEDNIGVAHQKSIPKNNQPLSLGEWDDFPPPSKQKSKRNDDFF